MGMLSSETGEGSRTANSLPHLLEPSNLCPLILQPDPKRQRLVKTRRHERSQEFFLTLAGEAVLRCKSGL